MTDAGRIPLLTAQLAAQRDVNLALVRELERMAADLDRATARLDWLAAQRSTVIERYCDGDRGGWRLVVSHDRSFCQTYHATTLAAAIDRAGGEA